jgi:anaerobic ribonucleoside-triphosphate reductase activating protein
VIEEKNISVAGLAPASRVNGPGVRAVLWVQGCDLACPGCFNPQTHPAGVGRQSLRAVGEALLAAVGPRHDGITLSGGEPFQQAEALAALLRWLRSARPALTFMAFTGYRLEEALRAPGGRALGAELDWLVDGRFDPRRPGRRPWRASTNQRLWVLGRPLPRGALLGGGREAELHVAADGQVLLSGFPDAGLARAVRALGDSHDNDG